MQSLPVEKASIRRKAHGAPSLGTCGRKIGKHQKRLSDRLLQTLRQRYNENIRRKRFPPSSAFSPTRKTALPESFSDSARAHTGETSYGNAPVPSLKFARHAAKPDPCRQAGESRRYPPSTVTVMPVTYEEASEASQTSVPISSLGCPIRCMGRGVHPALRLGAGSCRQG